MVRGVGLQTRSVAVLGTAVEVVVLLDQLHELVLDVGELALRELVLVGTDLLLLEVPKETYFVLVDEQQGLARATSSSRSSADSVDVVIRIVGRVVLHNPVDLREVKTSLSHVRAD